MSGDDVLFRNYTRAPVGFTHGKGRRLWSTDGREYLDFIGGIATSTLGHAHPRLVEAIAEQARRYLHVSNLYRIPEQERAARMLLEAGREDSAASGEGLDRVFFCNSGTEANEAAIKIARKWGSASGRFEILVMRNGFHGRTLGSLAATGTPRYHEGFAPLPGGFVFADFNDLEGARRAVGDETCAVLVEPVQGEGGVLPAEPAFLEGLEQLCRERDLLFMLDEVQTAAGRSGSFFAFQHYGVRPDVVTLAKGIGGGVPVGAVMAREEIALVLVPGDHGSTFGGNALACAAVAAVLEAIREEGLLANVRAMAARLRDGLESLELVRSVRGLGLLLAAELDVDAGPVAARCLEQGLLINAVRARSVRFAPALNVEAGEIDRALEILSQVLASFATEVEAGEA